MVLGSSNILVDYGSFKSSQRLVRLSIEDAVRGITGIEAEVATGLGGGDCGYEFKLGQRYLVDAYRDLKTNRLSTSICTRTRAFAEAADDIAFFRSLPTADANGTIFGEVVKRNYEVKEGVAPFTPVADADLAIEGEPGNYEVKTDSQGSFRLSGVKPGTYKVKLQLPPGLIRNALLKDEGATVVENELTVAARGCAQTGFYLESDTRVSGRVIDDRGDAVSGLQLNMREVATNVFLNAATNAEGFFEFKIVPPGEYLLGFRILQGGQTPSPYPRTYYPGVAARSEAKVVKVEEGTGLRDLELRLPSRLTHYEVKGVVVLPDGRPAPGVNIYLSLTEEGQSTAFESLPADELGRFTF